MNSRGGTGDKVLLFLLLFAALYGFVNYTIYSTEVTRVSQDVEYNGTSLEMSSGDPTETQGWIEFNFTDPYLTIVNLILLAPLAAFVGFKIVMGLIPTGSGYQ